MRQRKFIAFFLTLFFLFSALSSLNILGYTPGILVMPMRCVTIHTTFQDFPESDVAYPKEIQECYSLFHKEFWTNWQQHIEFMWVFSVEKGWYWGNHTEYLSPIKEIIIHPLISRLNLDIDRLNLDIDRLF